MEDPQLLAGSLRGAGGACPCPMGENGASARFRGPQSQVAPGPRLILSHSVSIPFAQGWHTGEGSSGAVADGQLWEPGDGEEGVPCHQVNARCDISQAWSVQVHLIFA